MKTSRAAASITVARPAELGSPGDGPDTHTNRLSQEKSPYLLQHQHNPVDWHPWGEEAFARARELDRPIFLSVGYATCHWCHVMERECFEDSEMAARLNAVFVPVKVDREERPDLDDLYMLACHLLTGSGGWPLTVFLTPDGQPFFAGTYFPKESRFGRMGLMELTERVETLWRDRRADALRSAETLTSAMRKESGLDNQDDDAHRNQEGDAHRNQDDDAHRNQDGDAHREADPAGSSPDDPLGAITQHLGEEILDAARKELARRFDAEHGGFGRAPKFPMAHTLIFLLRNGHRRGDKRAVDMALFTLDAMRKGGIFDQLGLGFHRYATDARWLLPHFEKMLYDQALLALAYLEAAEITGEARYGRVAEEIFTYVLRDLRGPRGELFSAEDADSEGEEGRFYVFTAKEIRAALPPELAPLALEAWGVGEEGNFEDEATGRRTGANVLHRPMDLARLAAAHGLDPEALEARLEKARGMLLAHRDGRIRPLLDDKVLTDLNGLMIAALARGAQVLGRPDLIEAARQAADFVWTHLGREEAGEARLWHRHREGESGIQGFLDDYAFFIWGLCELHGATGDPELLERALRLGEALDRHHWDHSQGGYFIAADDGERLLFRRKTLYDGAIPSGNSVSLVNLLRLGRKTGNREHHQRAAALVQTFAGEVRQRPSAYGFFLLALDSALAPGSDPR